MQERLAQITRSLELLEQFASELSTSALEDSLNATTLVVSDELTQNVDFDRIRSFAGLGNRVEVALREGDWEARVSSASSSSFDVFVQGPWEDAFPDPNSIQRAKIAAENNNARTFLQSAGSISGDIRLTLLNDPVVTGMHWLRTVEQIHEVIARDSWFGFLSLIFTADRPSRLVLQNSGASSIHAGGLVVHGPDVYPELPASSLADEVAAYRRTWLRGSREKAPAPTWTLPTRSEGLNDVVAVLQGATGLLCWFWLAAEANVEAMPIRARFEGMRPVELDLELGEAPDSLEAVTLWEWATSTTDPARRESLQQAVSLSIRDERDLAQGFKPVLRTARYLLRISQQGIIAEALATRRTAREAAFSVARDSAEAARSSLRKTFDRLFIQLGAGAGVLLANHQALIDKGATLLLLSAILVLVVLTTLGAYVIDYPSVNSALDAFDMDLDHYRDALPEEDLVDIRNMESLRDARSQVRRTRLAAAVLLITAGIVVLVSLGTVAKSGEGRPSPSPSPSVGSP